MRLKKYFIIYFTGIVVLQKSSRVYAFYYYQTNYTSHFKNILNKNV